MEKWLVKTTKADQSVEDKNVSDSEECLSTDESNSASFPRRSKNLRCPSPSGPTKPSTSKLGSLSKKDHVRRTEFLKRKQKFRTIWLQIYPWLEKKTSPQGEDKPFCKCCAKFLTTNIGNIKRHKDSESHKNSFESLKKQPQIFQTDEEEFIKSKKNKIKAAELKIILFLLQFNLPFTLITPLILLMKAIAPDSEIVKDLKCGKTKATETTNQLFLKEGQEEIARVLRSQKFSIIIDETTDISTTKCLVLIVRYFDNLLGKVIDRFFGLIKLISSDAKTIFDELIKYFEEVDVPLQNMIGFASDNASVMMGERGGVQALFKNIQTNLFVMGCTCHSIHLCSIAASKKIPQDVEKLARDIYLFFSHSSKRQTEFREFQDYFNTKAHKILKTSSTRWLSLENVVSRILEQWVPLKHYFITYQLEQNSDLAHNIYAHMTDELKLYFYFLQYILRLTNKINIEYQSEEPRIHVLLSTVKMYFKTILSNLVKNEFIDDASLNSIDFCNRDCFLESKEIYLGAQANILIGSGDLTGEVIKNIRKTCRDYYIELCTQIRQRIKFQDKVLEAVQIIDPQNKSPSLTPLIQLFPNLIQEELVDDLDDEWRALTHQNMISKNLKFEDFWSATFNLKNALNAPMFPLLKTFVGSILCFPHSNASAERIFSQVALIKDKKRNSLLTSTVNSILMAKELIRHSSAMEWTPSKEILSKYK